MRGCEIRACFDILGKDSSAGAERRGFVERYIYKWRRRAGRRIEASAMIVLRCLRADPESKGRPTRPVRMRLLQGAGQEVGHRTPSNAAIIAHEFLETVRSGRKDKTKRGGAVDAEIR